MTTRATDVVVRAGCMVCHGGQVGWTSGNAMALAARHARASGHATWAEQTLRVSYAARPDADQAELFPLHPSNDGSPHAA